MGIGTLKYFDPSVYELLTESIDETHWWQVVHLIVRFMESIGVRQVHTKFGFIMSRNQDGLEQEPDRTVDIHELIQLIADSLEKGIIEMKGPSDFVFESVDHQLLVMLCNDVDVHIASPSKEIVFNLGHMVKALGIKVYDNGTPI